MGVFQPICDLEFAPGRTPICAPTWPICGRKFRPHPKSGQKGGFSGSRITSPCAYGAGGVPGGCIYCPSLRAIKLSYIGFQSMVLLILDNTFQCRVLGFAFGAPEIQPKKAVFRYLRKSAVKMTQKQCFSVDFKLKYRHKFLPHEPA